MNLESESLHADDLFFYGEHLQGLTHFRYGEGLKASLIRYLELSASEGNNWARNSIDRLKRDSIQASVVLEQAIDAAEHSKAKAMFNPDFPPNREFAERIAPVQLEVLSRIKREHEEGLGG